MAWFMGAMVAFVGCLLVAIPLLSRRTTPLGVSVPSSRLTDPAVRRGVVGFQVTAGVLTAIATAGAVTTAELNPLLVTTWLIGLIVAGMAAYAWWRRGIITAKRAGDWYAHQDVSVSAPITDPPVVVTWSSLHAVGLAAQVIAAVILALNYSRLPDPYPTHWGIDGTPDAFAARTPMTVGLVLVIGMVAVVTLWVIALVIARRREPVLPDGDPDAARHAGIVVRNRVLLTLALCSIGSSVLMAFIALVPMLAVSPAMLNVVLWPLTALITLVPVALMVSAARARLRVGIVHDDGPQSPDDDRFWKLGMFYYNPDDPSVMIPKRAGVGYDLNYAKPVGWVFAAIAIAAVVFGLFAPLLFPV